MTPFEAKALAAILSTGNVDEHVLVQRAEDANESVSLLRELNETFPAFVWSGEDDIVVVTPRVNTERPPVGQCKHCDAGADLVQYRPGSFSHPDLDVLSPRWRPRTDIVPCHARTFWSARSWAVKSYQEPQGQKRRLSVVVERIEGEIGRKFGAMKKRDLGLLVELAGKRAVCLDRLQNIGLQQERGFLPRDDGEWEGRREYPMPPDGFRFPEKNTSGDVEAING